MHTFRFRKDYAQQFLTSLQAGLPIGVPPGGWNPDSMLQLAGMVTAFIRSGKPHTWQSIGGADRHLTGLPTEEWEIEDPDHEGDIYLAMDIVAHTTNKILTGRYDAEFTPEYKAAVYCRADVNKALVAVEGKVFGMTPEPQSPAPLPQPPAPRRGRFGRAG